MSLVHIHPVVSLLPYLVAAPFYIQLFFFWFAFCSNITFLYDSYVFLSSLPGILVTASKSKDNSYSYNTVTVVLLTEVLKLVASTLLFIKE